MKKFLTIPFLIFIVNFNSYSQILDSLNIVEKTNADLDSLSLVKNDSIHQLKDSLLRLYYNVKKDTLTNKTTYTPRFRMVVDSVSKDTSFISIPKLKTYISINKDLTIDTLKAENLIDERIIEIAKKPIKAKWWNTKNSIGLDINEAAFVNWNAGGNNSVAGLLKVEFVRFYNKFHILWNNEIFARYGLNQQEEKGLRKTDDKLEINSTFGYRKDTVTNWYYSVKLNFKTQFSEGFKYPDTSSPISKFFSPAYLFLGAGAQYEQKSQQFSIYLSPATLKSTFVLDETLSNSGAFGVKKGSENKSEFGSLIQSTWSKELFKNVLMTNRLNLYTDYFNDFGNIDVNWDLNLTLTINNFIKTNIGTYLIYDNNIKFKDDLNNDGELETLGARVQLKQLLGIGVIFDF